MMTIVMIGISTDAMLIFEIIGVVEAVRGQREELEI